MYYMNPFRDLYRVFNESRPADTTESEWDALQNAFLQRLQFLSKQDFGKDFGLWRDWFADSNHVAQALKQTDNLPK